MKRDLLLISCLLYCLSSLPVNAQSTAPYLVFKTTYAFAANPQKINEAVAYVNNQEFTRGVYGSYGRGLCFQLGIGKMINPTFGFEVNGEFVLGNKVTTTLEALEDSISGSTSSKVRSVVLKPFIVIRNSGDLLAIYTKLGLAIATSGNLYEDGEITGVFAGQSSQTIYSSKETSRLKVGFAACFGLSFRVSESISFFTEVNGQMVSLPLTRGRYTKYTENGQNMLPGMKTSERSWEYKKEGFFDDADSQDPNRPGIKLYSPANFSYIGIGAGVTYHF